jgi:uncharacterized membrane protein
VGPYFWLALLGSTMLNTLAISLYARALHASDLSTTVPMLAFSPLFLLVTAPLILGEFPTFWGLVGVLLVVLGSYVLNIRAYQQGLLAPYRALLRERGPQLMLVVAFIWSIAATIDKIGILQSAPIFWVTAVNGAMALALTPLMLRTPACVSHIRRAGPFLLLMGIFSALALVAQMHAISLTLVPYVIAIKRSSILMSVVFGTLLFHEVGLQERLAGVVIMLAGVLCITLL